MCDRKLSTDIVIIYGNKTEKDIAFHEDFMQMEAENKRLKVVYTVDNPIDKTVWKGRIGFINSRMVKEEIPDYLERVFYICGPPKMVDSLMFVMHDELRLDKGKIKLENFSGYE